VRVIPTSVRDMSFRMRAKLEGRAADLPAGYLSPNLRIIPPFELSFISAAATHTPGLHTDGAAPSRAAEEIAEARAEGWPEPGLCLRFSMGLENAGVGYFVLASECQRDMLTPEVVSSCVTVDEHGRYVTTLHQQRWTADGTDHIDGPDGSAGFARLQPAHGHTHYDHVWAFNLFRIMDEDRVPGDPKPAALPEPVPGRKLGFEPTRELMTDWNRFYQDLVPAPKGGRVELPPGWGDVYEWNRWGYYVDFPRSAAGVPQSGYYVLLGTADPEGKVIEGDEGDNVSYALIRVGAREPFDVDLLERATAPDPGTRSGSGS